MADKFDIVFFETTKTATVEALDDITPYYDITFVLSGSLDYIINGDNITLKAGDAVFIKPKSRRIRLPKQNYSVRYISINFYAEKDKKIELPAYIDGCVTPNFHSLLVLMLSVYKDYLNKYVSDELDLYLNIVLLTMKKHIKQKNQSPYITPMLNYIQTHLTEKITLDGIANEVNLTPAYCCHIISDELNTTLTEIINRERILLAQSLILEKKKSLTEIAEICGFNSYSYFSRTFKKLIGITPNNYKI